MRVRLFTLHRKGAEGLRVVDDGFSFFALLLPPLWAVWHGLWITLAGQAVLLGLASLWSPFAVGPVWVGIAAVLGFEGGAVHRVELGLRRWREAGVVEARSPEGAEELYLTGRAA